MLGLEFSMVLAEQCVRLSAEVEGRVPTQDDYLAAYDKVFNAHVEAGTKQTLALAGLADMERRKTGFWGRLFG